jgi:molecular chaperone DnaJ
MRDFYEVLGLSRDASDGEIKKAYRRLAMQYHPDRNPGDRVAEEKFKEAATAYKVLSDPGQRARYDRFGPDGLRGGGFEGFSGLEDIFSMFGDLFGGGGRRRGPARGADLRLDLTIPFAEAVHGVTREVTVSRAVRCKTCSGSGAKAGTKPESCATCEGRGQVLHSQGFFVIQTTCPKCRGNGNVIRDRCADCNGSGSVEEESRLTVNVPAGVDDGQTLRLSGKGEASSDAHGAPGHLYVVLHVQPDERFVRDGDDVLTEVPISFVKAALGGVVEVPTLEEGCEGTAEVEVAPGTQPGDVIVRRGQGVPRVQGHGRGDHAIRFRVEIPKRLGKRERELLAELAGELGEPVSAGRRGLFSRKRP